MNLSWNWKQRAQHLSLLRRIPELSREVWKSSPVACILTLACRLVSAVFPVALLAVGGLLLDAINQMQRYGGSSRRIWILLGLEAALAILSDSLSRFASHCDLLLSDRFTLRLNLRLIRHCDELDLETFENPQFQDRLERARSQASSQIALLRSLLQIGQQTIGVVGMIAGAFVLAPGLIAIQLIGVLPIVIAESYFAKGRYQLNRDRTSIRRLMEYLLFLATNSGGAKEVKLFRLGPYLQDQYGRLGDAYNREDETLSAKQNLTASILMLISTMVYYAAYCVLIYRTAHGALTIGKLFFLGGALQRTKGQLSGLFMGFSRSLDQLMYISDVFEFFDEKPRIVAPQRVRKLPCPILRGIEFRHVCFAYAGASELVLRNVSFRIKPGERIALVGENGAGKTTIIKLLTRLYDPTGGQILIDGVDLREFDPNELRSIITAVFQDFTKYDLSAADNIGFGDIPSLQDCARIAFAAEESRARPIIDRLPRRYEQVLGRRFENGVDLSGGEWQRMALARACMRSAEIVILDEPTSALDARAESRLFQDFSEMVAGKMAVLISHRFSTVRIADRILVLDKGMIQEQGSHEELIAAGGEYAQLFELQAAGYR
jgi:ATP-binding cassette subfamily B protein